MAGDLRRLRGDRDKKSVPHCIVHACMNGLFFLTTELHRSFSSYITSTTLLQHFYNTFTSFLQPIHHFYITFASLLQHFYIIPSAHTSLLRQFHPLCHLYITPFLNVLTAGFPAAPATPHGHAINCASIHRYRGGLWWLSGRSSDFSR